MKHIGLISDTHSYLDEKVFRHFEVCDEIWHAGDIGNEEVANKLGSFKPFKAVHGNIDGPDIRQKYPLDEIFYCEGAKIFMTHIGGVPGKYSSTLKSKLLAIQPHVFICGHSHILRIITDKTLRNMLYINPGAAGMHGFHHMRTLVRFKIENGKIFDMQVIELGKRASI